MAKVATYIVKKHRSYLYKRPIPRDLQTALRAKAWTKSLGRLDDREAVMAAMELAQQQDAIIKFIRGLDPEHRAKVEELGFELYRKQPEGLRVGASVVERVVALEDDDGAEKPENASVIVDARKTAKRMRTDAAEIEQRLTKLSGAVETIEAVIPAYVTTSNPSKERVEKVRLYARRFVGVTGPRPITAITREHIVAFRNYLEEEVAAGKFSARTAEKHLEAVARLLRVGLNDNVIAVDPSTGIKIRTRSQHDDKKPFEAEHVAEIFKAAAKESEDFQLVLKLLAYHGMRSGEAAKLRIDDVVTTMGVQVLRIHDGFGPLKNKWSKREIPVHPKCKVALDAHVARLRAGGTDDWLFPTFKAYAAGRGAWLQRVASDFLRDDVGITDKNLTLHSFRHTFRTLAREVEMPEAISSALMGHSPGRGEHGKYGTAPSLAKRAEWIAKIDPLAGA